MLKNSAQTYGWLTIFIHWLMAVMVFFIFGLGLYMVELTYYDAWYKGSLDLHKSLGVMTALVLLLRWLWRLANIQPDDISTKVWEKNLAHTMHFVLYIVLFLLVTTGYLISTAKGQAVVVFEIFSVPALPWQITNQEDMAGKIHEIVAWLMIILALTHALAALKHHFITKNDVLIRMLSHKKVG